VTVYLQAESGDGGMSVDFVTTTPNYFFGPNPQYRAELSGSDRVGEHLSSSGSFFLLSHPIFLPEIKIFFQHCFQGEEEDQTKPFYIGMTPWAGGTYTVRVSTHKKVGFCFHLPPPLCYTFPLF
jgi:hypothetical protein